MTYIDLINGFWRLHREKQFSPDSIAVMFHLMNLNNYHRWVDWFELSYENMSYTLKLEKRKCMRSVRELSQKSAISVQKRGGRLANKYSIKSAMRYHIGTTNGLQTVPQLDHNLTTNGTLLKSIEYRDKRRGGGSGAVAPPSPTPPSKPTNAKPPPRLFISELKIKREILEDRLKAVRYRGHEDPVGGLQYSDPKDRQEARELKAKIKEIEDRMLDG